MVTYQIKVSGWCNGYTLDSHSGGSCFDSWPDYWLSWHFSFSSGPLGECRDSTTK